jgi:voltage-gated potassium channel
MAVSEQSASRLGAFGARFLWALALAGALVVIGTVGYLLIMDGWSVSDAVYMTVITLSAVGYGEVRPLTEAGRLFTMVLLLGGITWMGLWFALITSFIVELDLTNVLRRRRTMRDIGQMRNHFIVCGAGRTGRQVAEELEAHGAPWVILDRDPSRIEEILTFIPDAYTIEADATIDQSLLEAGLKEARGLISCLSADTDNLFVSLSARDLNPDLTIVVRAYEEETMDKLYRAGATYVVSPNVSGAIRMASVLLRPSVVAFLDIATRSSRLALRMEQANIGPDSHLAGKTLAEARIPQETGLIVIGLRKRDAEEHEFVFNPIATTRLESGDEMIVLGREEQIASLKAYANAL